ncbi:MAG: glycosyl hydrolase [Planctomycetes bacterium]|nr:glycosyl hydrolase [Planctomycetota bacterium]
MNRLTSAVVSILLVTTIVVADDKKDGMKDSKLTSDVFSGLKLRSIGPALKSGRIADIAVDPVKQNTWYVAAGSGNLWKTTNAGTTWEPIFENYGSYSIGCVTVDPKNRFTVWVGTGEAVGGRHCGYGDGVYKSLDGGKSFVNVGLKQTEHLAKILVDPLNSDVGYVAAQGPLWSSGGERGLYKTADGGKTWQCILAKGPYTGVTDVVFDPRNPDIIFAATHQRHRTVAALINGGPESGIHKSTDGGQNWRELKKGLPAEDKGKISLAVSPQKPDIVYATIELAGRKGGFWRSGDGGESWKKQSDYISGGTGPHYYQEIWADPHRFDVVYQANVRMGRTEDGGKTWQTVESKWKHVDNHALVFSPHDPDYLLVGCDGGLYRSYDYGKTFQYSANLPLTQFYKLSLDNDQPFYNVIGGTQDNNTQYGPTRTGNSSGIRNADWRTTIGGDGHDCAIDPNDPNTIYCEMQNGYLRRYDRRTGTSIDIRPQPAKGEDSLRFNWDSPILISPHSHTRLYFGSQKLHRSDDRGDSWTEISPDLSRSLDRFKGKLMGRVWSVDATWDLLAMSQFGNITSISESPLQEGLIYVGTDDGLIQVTEDGGKHWRKIDKIYGIPEFAFVNDVKADLHDANVVYAVFDNHKTGDFKPYIMRSGDRGRSWKPMVGDLPDRHIVWRIVQDHVKPVLLFIGTEFGLFFTVDGGERWIKLSGNVPTIPFRDIEIQKRENDLVGASFGRSFFVLDDFSPLRTVSQKRLEEEFVLFPARKSLLYVPARVLGSEKGSQGDAYFSAANPPFGAVFTYYLCDGLKTRKKVRHEKEAEIKKAGGDNPYPGFDELKKEEREEAPLVIFTIADAGGKVVNRITGPTTAGFHRIAWNLRYASFTANGGRGPLVTPGTYAVSAAKRVGDILTPLGESQTFQVEPIIQPGLAIQDRAEVLEFQRQAGELVRAVVGAKGRLQETIDQLAEMKSTIRKTQKTDLKLLDEARSTELKLLDLRDRLTGDTTRTSRHQMAPMPTLRRAEIAYEGSLNSTYGPTKTHRQAYAIAAEENEELRTNLISLIEGEFARLKKKLDDAGVPWTTGRSIPELGRTKE